MYCPNCGKRADMDLCMNCGTDMRNIVIFRPDRKSVANKYEAYRRFYPDKIRAIQALRIDTGMDLVEAKRVIDDLFGTSDTAAWGMKSADTVKVDVRSVAKRHYPYKGNAIRALCSEGMNEREARIAIEEAFSKIGEEKRRAEEERQKKVQKAVKTVGKGVGLAALTTGYIGLSTIAKLTKPYVKKRR